MSVVPRLVGMIHLLPLPGAPRYGGSLDSVLDAAISDARALADSGFPSLMVENFGDSPFFGGQVPPETVAAMTRAAITVADEVHLPLGVNVLRNDAVSALAVAAATGAAFIRVNVLAGTMYTDQGPITGRAADLMRARVALAPQVEVWADVMVKHAVPPAGTDLAQSAADLVERSGADAIIVSGTGTGREPDLDEGRIVRAAIPKGTRVVVGSGAATANLSDLLSFADTVIVGSSIKPDADPTRRVDPTLASRFAEEARRHGLI